ncbi:hypothetical protein [Bacillus benzoevorans]|uniref:Uncharacterized protein n=1 Tax=Bacillus benzoevorans TaxID=1456 RepID=A0A7X0HR56_9BACI|nr:hypothetical protein [Bacillus benzoevorans]MBB6445216.1 hypothetical protein [Bacillus benzoevorans]
MFWKKKEQERTEGIAWFSYTVLLPDIAEDENEITVIGNLTFKNTGNTTIHNPFICIRIKPVQDVRLGGKIGAMTHTALTIDGTNTESWHYIHDNWKKTTLETGEHWLKPNHSQFILPNDILTFSNELHISTNKEEKYVTIEGYFYSDEIKNGLTSLNNIIINF